jgi:hypothetical protein
MAVFSSISKTLPNDGDNDPPSTKTTTTGGDAIKSVDDLGFAGPSSNKHDEFSLAKSPTRKMSR